MRRIDRPSDKDQILTGVIFLELLHLRCKDVASLEETLNTRLRKHPQWTSPIIQNELLEIFADLFVMMYKRELPIRDYN